MILKYVTEFKKIKCKIYFIKYDQILLYRKSIKNLS